MSPCTHLLKLSINLKRSSATRFANSCRLASLVPSLWTTSSAHHREPYQPFSQPLSTSECKALSGGAGTLFGRYRGVRTQGLQRDAKLDDRMVSAGQGPSADLRPLQGQDLRRVVIADEASPLHHGQGSVGRTLMCVIALNQGNTCRGRATWLKLNGFDSPATRQLLRYTIPEPGLEGARWAELETKLLL